MNYWSVLSGSTTSDHNFFDLLEDLSVIGIGWQGVGDVHDSDWHEIREKVRKFVSGSEIGVGLATGVIYTFSKEMQIGDIVLTRKPHDQVVLIGQITGEYTFNSSPQREILSHTRTVEWLRTDITFDEYRSAFGANGKEVHWSRLTVENATQYAGEINQLLGEIEQSDGDVPGLVEDGIIVDTGLRFGLERELQDALKKNLHQLEPGMALLDTERTVPAGRADIVARDSDGTLVVIELKAGTAQPDSMTQLLAYMGSIDNPESRQVRGILVAHSFDSKVRHASRAVPNVSLRSYSFSLSFTDVEES